MPLRLVTLRNSGIEHWPVVRERDPEAKCCGYHRASSRSQDETVWQNAEAFRTKLIAAGGNDDPTVSSGIEVGKLSGLRAVLLEAANFARENNLWLVADNWTRFIRAEAHHGRTNPNAIPKRFEFEKLFELVGHIKLATLERPDVPESEFHDKTITRTGKAGRRRSYDLATLQMLWKCSVRSDGSKISYQAVAKICRLSKSTVNQLMQKVVELPSRERLPFKVAVTKLGELSEAERSIVLLQLLS